MSLVQFLYKIYKLRLVFAGGLTVVLAGLTIHLISTAPVTAQAEAARTQSEPVYDSPNVVANGASKLTYEFGQSMTAVQIAMTDAARLVSSTAISGGRTVASGLHNGAIAAGRGLGRSTGSVGRAAGSSISLIIRTPGNVLGSIADAPIVNKLIRPADHQEDVPIIDPDSPELHAALANFPVTEKDSKKPLPDTTVKPQWPINGRVTTEFGVDHWPYQHTHTGIDISDNQIPGITPVKPFRPGRVIKTILSNSGLGNHVIVDHGTSLTSVYAHLSSISVKTGEQVNLGTTLGLEGSTGVSTGTHLHFEIRVNGKSANPRQFIGGNP